MQVKVKLEYRYTIYFTKDNLKHKIDMLSNKILTDEDIQKIVNEE